MLGRFLKWVSLTAVLALHQHTIAAPPVVRPLHVVKVVSFHCKYSQESSSLDAMIAARAKSQGGKFVLSPISADGSNFNAALVYYAIRPYLGEHEPTVVDALYKGAIDNGLPFESPSQVTSYLNDMVGFDGFNWPLVDSLAEGDDAKSAASRAVKLTVKSGITMLPAYLIVRDGELIAAFERSSGEAGWQNTLRSQVLTYLDSKGATKK